MQHNVLLVDLGNTRCKSRLLSWTDFTDVHWQDLQVTQDPLHLIKQNQNIDTIYLASVRSDETNAQILRECERQNIQLHRIETQAQQFNLTNSYDDVSKMGVDRWLAMLGAQLFSGGNFLMIDSGTAITCDAVVNNRHVGGWISPGFNLLRRSVTANTARVASAEFSDHTIAFGRDTEACLHYGCVAQLQGVVAAAAGLMKKHINEYQTIISGGDSKIIESAVYADMPSAPLFIDNIVLFGLLQFALADMPQEQLKQKVLNLIK